jgi:hypothetical protein
VLVEHLCCLAYSGIVEALRERWSETARRFNPTGEAGLPVLHTERGDWQFTVVFIFTLIPTRKDSGRR